MPSRNNMMPDGTPLQQSMTFNMDDYDVERMSQPMLGVVLDVRASDDINNRSAREWEDRRGYMAECTVLIISDSLILENVLITPDSPAGLDDYTERLPRASSNLCDGSEYKSSLGNIDPYQLDGDWCIVGFVKGIIDSPYVLRWWPNPNNRFDTATSGRAFPNPVTGEGRSLKQAGRYFSRVNGVECTVSREGDLLVSTRFSNSAVDFVNPVAVPDQFTKTSTEGRWLRSEKEVGGSVKLLVKPTQTFEIDFHPEIDGYAWQDLPSEDVPQTNPVNAVTFPPDRTFINYSYIKADSDSLSFKAPEAFRITTNEVITLNSGEDITATSPSIYLVASTEVIIGSASSEQYLALGTNLANHLGSPGVVLSPMGPLTIRPPTALTVGTEAPPGWELVQSDKHKVEDIEII